jgi:hypothetical protein
MLGNSLIYFVVYNVHTDEIWCKDAQPMLFWSIPQARQMIVDLYGESDTLHSVKSVGVIIPGFMDMEVIEL